MKQVAVIFGGMSEEHDVSCVSASYIAEHLNKEQYRVLLIGITKSGGWYWFRGPASDLRNGTWEQGDCLPCRLSPNRGDKGLLISTAQGMEILPVDVIFPALHGRYGEDGCIQGLFELAGIPYVGCGVAASKLGLDKVLSKMAFAAAGLPQADWVLLDHIEDSSVAIAKVEQEIGYPCFVKPANTGSSIGISKAKNREQLVEALRLAETIDPKILVEKEVVGRELECAVLGNQAPQVSCVGEVLSAGDFYDYESKYENAASQTVIPANLPIEVSDRIRELAIRAYQAIGGSGLSRADFFLAENGKIFVNELNTLPGFTQISMYPKLWAHDGIPYEQLLDQLIALAEERVYG